MPQRTRGSYWVVLALFLIGLGAYAAQHDLQALYAGYRHSGQEVRDLGARLESLRSEEQALREDVSGLGDDPLEMEAAIRSSKGLVREGETIYRVELAEDHAL